MEEFFALTKYIGWTAQGRQIYGCRGQGSKYNQFWKEFSYKATWEKDDWPWSYFALNDTEEKLFLSKYDSIIWEMDDGYSYDEPLPEPPTKEQILLNTIITEEIQAEINREVIRQICRKATDNT